MEKSPGVGERIRRHLAAAVAMILAGLAVATGAGAAPAPDVRFEGGRLSLDATDLPLENLLVLLARTAGLSFSLRGDASGIRVSDSFESVELSHALGRLLSQRSHLIVDHRAAGAPRHVELILLGAGRSQSSHRVIEPPFVETETPGEPVYDEQALTQMLADPDAELRRRAIENLKDTADDVPFAALAQVAREDTSPARRAEALALLVERSENGESAEPLRVALMDADAEVRDRARELIEDWHVNLAQN